MSFEPRLRGDSARGSSDGRLSSRPGSGRNGAATPSAYAGVGVRAVSTVSHLQPREFTFGFDLSSFGTSGRGEQADGARVGPGLVSSNTRPTVRTASARTGDFGVSPSVPSSVRPSSRATHREETRSRSTGSTFVDGTSRQSTAGTSRDVTMPRVTATPRASSARPGGTRHVTHVTYNANTHSTKVGFGTHTPSNTSRQFDTTPPSRPLSTSESSHHRSAPKNTRASPAPRDQSASGSFPCSMSTERAIAAAWSRARGEFADFDDLIDHQVAQIKAQRPCAASATVASRREATNRLHRGVPVSPKGGPEDRAPTHRPTTASTTGEADSQRSHYAARPESAFAFGKRGDGVQANSLQSNPSAPAMDAARAAAAAQRLRAVDPSGSTHTSQVTSSTGRLPARPSSGVPNSARAEGAVFGVDSALGTPKLETRVFERSLPTETRPPQPPREKVVHWAPSPSPARGQRASSAVPNSLRSAHRAPGSVPGAPPAPAARLQEPVRKQQEPFLKQEEPFRKQQAPAQAQPALRGASGVLRRDDLLDDVEELPTTPLKRYVRRHQTEYKDQDQEAHWTTTASTREPVESDDDSRKAFTKGESDARVITLGAETERVEKTKPPVRRSQSARPVMRVAEIDDSGTLPGYVLGPVIGEGGFCKVRSGIHQVTGAKTAVKLIDKSSLKNETDRKRVSREIRVLKKLNHKNIVRLFDVVETARKIFCVMEYAAGGSVLDFVRSKRSLDEPTSAKFTGQIVEALSYCHANWIAHRDVKLENLLLDFHKTQVLLIDFGLAGVFAPGKKLTTHCGSPSYAAPEIVSRKPYDGPPVDVWSLGVVAFAMVTGYLPFHAKDGDKKEMCRKIVAGAYQTPKTCSTDFAEFIGVVLRVDPETRATLQRCRDTRWVRNASLNSQRHLLLNGNFETQKKSFPDENAETNDSATTERAFTYPAAPSGGSVDQQRVNALVESGFERDDLVTSLKNGEHNYRTAAYHLLAYRDKSDSANRDSFGDLTDPAMSKQSGRARSAARVSNSDVHVKHATHGHGHGWLPTRPATAMLGMKERRAEAAALEENLRRLNF